jgi:hypothetical protein
MKKYTKELTYYWQRGSLTYMKSDYTYRTVEGWFYVDKNTVIARKKGGRNIFSLCSFDVVFDFKLHEKEK